MMGFDSKKIKLSIQFLKMNTVNWMICLCIVKICDCYGMYVNFLNIRWRKMLLSKRMNLNKT